MFRALKISLVGLTVLGLAGCGKSNPASDYKNLKTQPYQINSYASTDQRLNSSAFVVKVEGNNDKNNSNFVEGVQGAIRFNIIPLYPSLTDEVLTSSNIPGWGKLSKVGPHIWTFTGTPPYGTVLPGADSSHVQLDVVAHVLPNGDPSLQGLIGQASVTIDISKTNDRPKIEGVSGYKAVINEGESFDFSVEVSDPAGRDAPTEIIAKAFDSGENKENFKIDGSRFIQAETKGSLAPNGNGRWIRKFTFNTADFARIVDFSKLPNPQANSVKVCENFMAISASGRFSPDDAECTEVRFVAQSPEFSFLGYPIDYTPIQLKAGTTNTIKFTAAIQNKSGVADVKAKSNFNTLPGHPDMVCLNGDNNDVTQRVCTITWQIPCKPKLSTYTLDLTGTNTQAIVGRKAKENPISRVLQIAPADAGCVDATSPAPVQKPAPAPKAAVSTAVATAVPATSKQGQMAVSIAKAPATKDLKAQRADKQVGAVPAKSENPPPLNNLNPDDLAKKKAVFAVQNPRAPSSSDKTLTPEEKDKLKKKAVKKPPMRAQIKDKATSSTDSSAKPAPSTDTTSSSDPKGDSK